MSEGGRDSSDDKSLVVAARRGSDAAFAALVDRHGKGVRAFLARICPNPDEADDLAQEAFLTAWTRLALLRDPTGFRAWLYGIAWRKAKMATRSMARTRARDSEWAQAQPAEFAPDAANTIALKQGLKQLSPEQRAAVAITFGAGLSHSEAARALDLPLGTLKSHVSRGRAKLQETLGEGGAS